MYRIENVTGYPGGECHLVLSARAAVLLEAGYDFSADAAIKKIKQILGKRQLDAILLTHSHYDHAGGAAKIKRAYPAAQVIGSGHTAAVFQREGARRLMRELNDIAARRADVAANADAINELRVDTPVQGGQRVRFGDMTIRAVASPGHTKCSLSYYFEETGLLAACETLGIAPAYPALQSCYVVGYRMALDSIESARALHPRHVFVSHYGQIPDADVPAYFSRAAAAAEALKNTVLDSHAKGMDREAILDALVERFYIDELKEIQPVEALRLNYGAMIDRTLEEFGPAPGE